MKHIAKVQIGSSKKYNFDVNYLHHLTPDALRWLGFNWRAARYVSHLVNIKGTFRVSTIPGFYSVAIGNKAMAEFRHDNVLMTRDCLGGIKVYEKDQYDLTVSTDVEPAIFESHDDVWIEYNRVQYWTRLWECKDIPINWFCLSHLVNKTVTVYMAGSVGYVRGTLKSNHPGLYSVNARGVYYEFWSYNVFEHSYRASLNSWDVVLK